MKPSIAGFMTGAVLPEVGGIYLLAREVVYDYYHPLPLVAFRCGNTIMLAWALILVAGPVMGGLGSLLGISIEKLHRCVPNFWSVVLFNLLTGTWLLGIILFSLR